MTASPRPLAPLPAGEEDGEPSGRLRGVGFWGGLAAFAALLIAGRLGAGGLTSAGWSVAATGALLAVWWVTEAIPVPATSLLPLVLFPVLGVAGVATVASAYAHPLILLLMGGFFIAVAIEGSGLHHRIALSVVLAVGTRPDRLVLGFLVACALVSCCISNTATTLMMLPIAAAVAGRTGGGDRALSVGLMLAVAYGSSIGGIGTPIGTAPNLIFMAQYEKAFPGADPISFLGWMRMALPIAAVMVVLTWLALTRWPNRVRREAQAADGATLRAERAALGPMTSPEARVLAVFVVTASMWVFRAPIDVEAFTIPGWTHLVGLGDRVDDGTIAIAAAVALFILPAGRGRPGAALLDWATASRIPWGVLLLFGGGLALADAFQTSGVSGWVGVHLRGLAALPVWAMVPLVCAAVVFLTEVTSNTALTTILMPILAAVCIEQRIDPTHLMIPAALSASYGFMLPVGTPPNAIVFGSGHVRMADMVRCGFVVNLIGVVVMTLFLT